MARIVVPGLPHHITQRGVRKQRTFFCNNDYQQYLALLKRACDEVDTAIWAYCLMPNHIHIVAVPSKADGLASVFRRANGEYAKRVNAREEWSGHLWQQRFYSSVMDETHAISALRYVEQNPVRAMLVEQPRDWRWSSARSHLGLASCEIVDLAATRELVSNWSDFLMADSPSRDIEAIRKQTRTGRPAGGDVFIDMLEERTGRRLRPRKPGPRKKYGDCPRISPRPISRR